MYILLNTHHDESIFKFKNDDYTASLNAFEKIWTQIAEAFKDYDEKLIFDGLNEPRTKGSKDEWGGGTAEERANLNKYYQKFVDVVRGSGGKNTSQRFLLINTYAASAETAAMDGLTLPTDTVQKKLIASYHAYSPYEFALLQDKTKNTWSKNDVSDTSGITYHINRAQSTFISKGIPVIIGEFGAMNKDNTATRAEWAEYYTAQARVKGIPCFWWDNGATTGDGELFGLLDRNTNKFVYPEIVKALMRGSR
jgi:endoglucanase